MAACGFEYHGPKQHIGFAPCHTPEKFKCAFTSAEGWGSFAQQVSREESHFVLEVKWGNVPLKTIALRLPNTSDFSAKRMRRSMECTLLAAMRWKAIDCY